MYPLNAAFAARRSVLPFIHDRHHPTAHGPRFFADTADIDATRPLMDAHLIQGVTTNPTLLKKAGAKDWEEMKAILSSILRLMRHYPVSLELTSTDSTIMLEEAHELAALGDNAVIKVPIGGFRDDPFCGLKIIRKLYDAGIPTNATLIFNTTQALYAAHAGATFVSPFVGRLADYCQQHDDDSSPQGNALFTLNAEKKSMHAYNTPYVAQGGDRYAIGTRLIHEIATVFANFVIKTEIIAASIRNPAQITEAITAGADIVTVPPHLLEEALRHPLTEMGMQVFQEDAKGFEKN